MEAGGYDENLRSQKAQGCEDLSLYFAIAERSRFAVVRERLTGYRWTPSNMSSDALQMLRSYDLVMNPKKNLYPQYETEFAYGRVFLIKWLLKRALQYGRVRSIRELLRILHEQDPKSARRWLLTMPYLFWTHRRTQRRRRTEHFLTAAKSSA